MPVTASPKAKRAAGQGHAGAGGHKAQQKRRGQQGGADSPAVGVLQPKLRVSEPGDMFEREADRVADRVMRAPAPSPRRSSSAASDRADDEQEAPVQREKTEKDEDKSQTSPLQREKTEKEEERDTSPLQRAEDEDEETPESAPVQRQASDEEETDEDVRGSALQRREADEEDKPVQCRAKRPRTPKLTRQFETDLELMRRGGGQPLPDSLRDFLEPRFGRSLGDVRVHVGRQAAELAREAGARAFTVGRHIVFGAGEYRPGAEQGRRLIAHELTHVFQQRGGLHSVQREVGPDREPPAAAGSELPTIEELRAAFNLDSEAAPPSVRTVALALLRAALLNRSDAERLKALTHGDGEAASLVRRVVSGRYTLELAAVRGGAGVERGWKLTNNAKRKTFVLNPGDLQWPVGSSADGNTITLTSKPSPKQYPKSTVVAGLESAREGGPTPVKQPALVPETIPAGTVPDTAPPLPTPESAPDKAPEPRPADSATPAASELPSGPLELRKHVEVPSEGGAKPAATDAAEAEGGAPAAEPEHAPVDPKDDPEFQKTAGQIRQTRKAQGKHSPPGTKLQETEDSAVLPPDTQRENNDRGQHLAEIGKVAEESKQVVFTPETFKAKLAESLEKIKLPTSESEAKKFKRERPLEDAKENIRGQVEDQKEKMAGPLATEVSAAQPPPSNIEVKEPAELTEEKPGERPRPINPVAAAPKPRLDSEVSMEAESRSLDDKMTEHHLTEEQLAESNEPTFIKALDAKKEAQQQAADAPGRYREQEQQILGGAQSTAKQSGAVGFGGMFKSREGAFGEVYTEQDAAARDDKAEQVRVVGELKKIYEGTKSDVDKTLDELTSKVNDIFSKEVDAAKKCFEEKVEEKLDDIYGITVIDDWIFGEDTEAINEVFRVEKERFLTTMDGVLDRIAKLIAEKLNAAITRIQKGRTDAKTFYDGLDKKQQKLAKEAMDLFENQFDTLEDSVRDKQQELADSLAEAYKTNVESLRESFDKIKDDVSKGWIGGAIEFIEEVGEAIAKLADLLTSVLSRVANVVSDILAHPIRFLEHLAEGVANGFSMFIDKIDEYLISGFFDWLRGSVGGAGITLPEKFDAAGIFSLVAQILGLTWDNFREIAKRVWGEPAVEFLEKAAAVAEKGLEIFFIVREKGLGGLWDYIVETVGNHVDEIITKVKETILYETIKKALAYIAGLFNPVGAFIKAAQAIYAGLRFLIDNIDRIAELVDAFLTSVEMAVAGQTDVISKKIVKALQGVIVMAIDFLAKLLGLGNLGEKVHKILNAIRKPVERAIETVLKKLRPFVQKVLGRLGVGVKGEDKDKEKEEGEDGRPLTHDEVIAKVVSLMSQETQAETPAAALAEKKEQARSLVKKYQPMLKKGKLSIVIMDKDGESVAEDAAVDFDVSASPGQTGEAPVRLKVDDKGAARKRFAHARTLKKFTSDKGFDIDDWAGTFTDLSRSTHQADLRLGVEEKIVKKKDSTYFFKDVKDSEVVDRGAAAIRDHGREYEPFVDSRFGIRLIQTFLSGRKIPGVPPDSYGDTGVVGEVAEKAVAARALRRVGSMNAWMLPKTPARRDLPAGWGGTSHIRPRYYDRGAGFPEIAEERVNEVIKKKVVPKVTDQLENIKTAKKNGTEVNWSPWQSLIDAELAKPNERFYEGRARSGFYFERPRYHLDHVKPLAEHWNTKGYNSDQNERIAANQGKRGGFQVLEASVNESKGSGGIKYQLWVGPDFTSPFGDDLHADGDELFVIKTRP